MPLNSACTMIVTAAKAAFGVGVFTATMAAWSVAGPDFMAHRPLPDGGVEGRCAIWFVGSSSIHRWTSMARDLAPWEVHNRGVNGALIGEVTARFLNEPAQVAPAAIVIYLGENDIADGAAPDDVARDVEDLVRHAERRMPHAQIYVIGLKPSPTRWTQYDGQQRVNAALAADSARNQRLHFLDVGHALLVNGAPGPFYQPDGIHLDVAGYRRWASMVRAGIEASMSVSMRRACDAVDRHRN